MSTSFNKEKENVEEEVYYSPQVSMVMDAKTAMSLEEMDEESSDLDETTRLNRTPNYPSFPAVATPAVKSPIGIFTSTLEGMLNQLTHEQQEVLVASMRSGLSATLQQATDPENGKEPRPLSQELYRADYREDGSTRQGYQADSRKVANYEEAKKVVNITPGSAGASTALPGLAGSTFIPKKLKNNVYDLPNSSRGSAERVLQRGKRLCL